MKRFGLLSFGKLLFLYGTKVPPPFALCRFAPLVQMRRRPSARSAAPRASSAQLQNDAFWILFLKKYREKRVRGVCPRMMCCKAMNRPRDSEDKFRFKKVDRSYR